MSLQYRLEHSLKGSLNRKQPTNQNSFNTCTFLLFRLVFFMFREPSVSPLAPGIFISECQLQVAQTLNFFSFHIVIILFLFNAMFQIIFFLLFKISFCMLWVDTNDDFIPQKYLSPFFYSHDTTCSQLIRRHITLLYMFQINRCQSRQNLRFQCHESQPFLQS